MCVILTCVVLRLGKEVKIAHVLEQFDVVRARYRLYVCSINYH